MATPLNVACCTWDVACCTWDVACCTWDVACCRWGGPMATPVFWNIPEVSAARRRKALIGLTLAAKAHTRLVLQSPPPWRLEHLTRLGVRLCHICPGTGLTAATSAPRPGSPLRHLHRDWQARRILKPAIRLGVPAKHRELVWSICSGAATSQDSAWNRILRQSRALHD